MPLDCFSCRASTYFRYLYRLQIKINSLIDTNLKKGSQCVLVRDFSQVNVDAVRLLSQ